MRPTDLPPADSYPHGIRARYTSGCRCQPCRAANAAYQRKRAVAKVWHGPNGLVSVEAVRRHLLTLSRKGVGRRTVALVARVPQSMLSKIVRGDRHLIRVYTERRILAVNESSRRAGRVDAKRTWRLIHELLEEGFTRAEIARRMGYARPALQFRRGQVLAKTALKVEQFHRSYME